MAYRPISVKRTEAPPPRMSKRRKCKECKKPLAITQCFPDNDEDPGWRYHFCITEIGCSMKDEMLT